MHLNKKIHPAFTIVELLIVVVVIAILAAITIVSYNGITYKAKESSLKSDLNTAVKKVSLVQAETGEYPATKPAGIANTVQYTGGGSTFCATASKDGLAFNVTQAGAIQAGACDGHTIAGGDGSGSTATTMQGFTSSQCAALSVYTGSNASAIVNLTDSRGGVTRTYEVAKLADNRCWMLTNLKLGSETGSVTLSASDSNVPASGFTLPQLTTTGMSSSDLPQAVGPVQGDTGTGETNYGYLYNWVAATAGETPLTMPKGPGNAQYSICPAGWRLPTAGVWNAAGNEGEILNTKMSDAGATPPSGGGSSFYPNWLYGGPFKGVLSGEWLYGDFYEQGSGGYFFTRTNSAAYDDSTFRINISPSFVTPSNQASRVNAHAIRCILN